MGKHGGRIFGFTTDRIAKAVQRGMKLHIFDAGEVDKSEKSLCSGAAEANLARCFVMNFLPWYPS